MRVRRHQGPLVAAVLNLKDAVKGHCRCRAQKN